jgi:hypothetical protein
MAHADYECCAICDNKQAYNSSADSKEMICSYCVAEMARNGVIIGSVNELINWINSTDLKTVKDLLIAVGFTSCYYTNPVDSALEKKGVIFDLKTRKIMTDGI